MTAKPDYDVGRGRPPVATRFEKGRSGNPAGRPKGSRNISNVIGAALAEKVTVTENGQKRTITKLEAAAKQMANKAAGGDSRAAKLIIELLHQAESRDEARAGPGVTADERRASDMALLDALRQRVVAEEPAVE